MSVDEIEEAVRGLKEFGFDEFRDGHGIIDDMLRQIPAYLAAVQSTSPEFWNSVEGAETYDAKLALKATKNPVKYNGMTWKTDPIEKGRRIWEWWRKNHALPGIHFFAVAARLVALVQVSSASVESIFSQLDVTRDAPLADTINGRVFQRCNNYLFE